MKNKNLNCRECGNDEFVADSNKYDIFTRLKEGKLKFQKEELLQRCRYNYIAGNVLKN